VRESQCGTICDEIEYVMFFTMISYSYDFKPVESEKITELLLIASGNTSVIGCCAINSLPKKSQALLNFESLVKLT